MECTWAGRVEASAQQLLGLVVLQDVALVLVTIGIFWGGVFVARRFGARPGYSLRALGMRLPEMGLISGAVLGVLVGLGALVASALVNVLSAQVLDSLGYPSENSAQEPLLEGIGAWVSESPALAVPAAFFVVAVLVPAVEEFIFRGAIFGGLYRLGLRLLPGRRRKGVESSGEGEKPPQGLLWASFVAAALASSVVFAALHFSPVILPALFIFALILCYVYWRTGSLLAPFFAHATFNAVPTLIIVLTSLGGLPTA